MKLAYISPSLLPSRTANSVHVVMQCHSLIQTCDEVVLYAKRTIPENDKLKDALHDSYGVDLGRAQVITFWSRFHRGDNLRIAVLGFIYK